MSGFIRKGVTTALASLLLFLAAAAHGSDTAVERQSMAGIHALGLFVEELQPNVAKVAAKAGIDAASIRREVERRLTAAGIGVVAGAGWAALPGRPFLYININTHETQRFYYAYDIKVELRQVVFPEANPRARITATTWSLSITGLTDIGNLAVIKNDTLVLVDRFTAAHRSVNPR